MDGVAANARVADTLIIALPIELTREQRHAAIAGFMEKIGHGRIAWLAAFHDLGNDEHNPHCHLIFRDAEARSHTDKASASSDNKAANSSKTFDEDWQEGSVTVCLLDREPVLLNMTNCDRYELREAEEPVESWILGISPRMTWWESCVGAGTLASEAADARHLIEIRSKVRGFRKCLGG